jgi:phage terminase large subunit
MEASQSEDQIDALVEWIKDPVKFVRDVFNVEPDKWQAEALQAIAKHDRVTIRSGHGIGKSAMMSWAIIWFLCTRPTAKIPCTAPTAHQLSDVLWGELAKWNRQMHPAIKGMIEVKQDMVVRRDSPRTAFAVARTARKEQPEAFQGFHDENLLFIIDEASGVEDVIFEVGEGAMSTKGAKVLMAGNPTRTSGYFYDSHHRMREAWYAMKVSSSDAKMVDQKFIDNMKLRYGDDSNVFRVRVMGEFPSAEDDTVITLELAESAVNRDVVTSDAKVIWGLDVARFGNDKTALAKRKGNTLLEKIKSWQGKDLMQTAGLVIKEYEETPYEDRPQMILVDSIGLGSGVVDRLREQGYPVRGINVAESPSVNSEKHMRLRDELWFKARDWFATKSVKIPADDELIADLTVPKYTLTSSGKLKVEGKDEIKKRLPRSPDLADAFCLTFAVGDRKFTSRIKYKNLGIV